MNGVRVDIKPFSSFNKGESSCCFIDFFFHQLLCILYKIIIWKKYLVDLSTIQFSILLNISFFLSAISIVISPETTLLFVFPLDNCLAGILDLYTLCMFPPFNVKINVIKNFHKNLRKSEYKVYGIINLGFNEKESHVIR